MSIYDYVEGNVKLMQSCCCYVEMLSDTFYLKNYIYAFNLYAIVFVTWRSVIHLFKGGMSHVLHFMHANIMSTSCKVILDAWRWRGSK